MTSEPSPNGNSNGNGNGNGRPFRDDLCLAIMAIPGYSLTDCAVLLWVAKRTFWGKAVCTALPSTITRELGGKICIRAIQYSLRRFEVDGLTVRCNLKSGPYPNRETALTEKFWETTHAVLAGIEPRRYGSTSTQFSAPYARTAHGDAPTSTQFSAPYSRTANGDAPTSTQFSAPYSRTANGDSRFANGDSRFANGDSRSGAPHIEERARSEFSITSLTTTTDARDLEPSSSSSSSSLAALGNESGGTGGLNECATLSPVISELVARVRGLWPDEPLIERRLAELADQGEAEAALAVDYAVARKAKGLAYAVSTRKRWARNGYTLAECQAEVRAKAPRTPPGRPTAASAPLPAHVAPKPPSQDVDPVMADLMRQFNRARGPCKGEIAAMMAARSAELEAP